MNISDQWKQRKTGKEKCFRKLSLNYFYTKKNMKVSNMLMYNVICGLEMK